MKCPACETVDLLVSERQGVEIDYCPKCRGMWLDRGELDRITERLAQFGQESTASTRKSKRDYDSYYEDAHSDDVRRDVRSDEDRRRHRKRDFLEDIFDLFD